MPLDPTWIAVVTSLATVAAIAFIREFRRQRAGRVALVRARDLGLEDPPSLHPRIEPSLCVGCGSCVEACPEEGVLELLDGRARLVNAAHCVGHGRCKTACPTGAIELVFGTAKRGIQVPILGADLQTSVPGIYVAGELSGLGLIRTAVNQAVQAVTHLAEGVTPSRTGEGLDVAIVGAGPAGIASALACRSRGLRHVILDQEGLGGSVLHYPRRKLVMTAPVELPIIGAMHFREVEKEELLRFWLEVVRRASLEVRAPARVTSIQPVGDRFQLDWERGSVQARRVILALGRRGTPRKLGVPGEESAKVAYRLLEPEPFSGRRVLVVGGGNSAVESAVALAEIGAAVTLSYRGDQLSRVAPANQERLQRLHAPSLEIVFGSQVRRIEPDRVLLQTRAGERWIGNDHVFVFAGGDLPIPFLEAIGVQTTTYFGEPPRAPLPVSRPRRVA